MSSGHFGRRDWGCLQHAGFANLAGGLVWRNGASVYTDAQLATFFETMNCETICELLRKHSDLCIIVYEVGAIAIVRIKEEKGFIDNTLIRFVEVFNDLDLIEESFYTKVKYGTDNPEAICLLKNGLSLSLALLLINSYSRYLHINVKDSEVHFQPDLIEAMEKEDENRILIYEVKNCM